MGRSRAALARLGLGLGGLLLGLGLAEALLRSPLGPARGYENLLARAPRLYDTRAFTTDPELGMVLAPGATARNRTPEFDVTLRVNRLGLRGPEPGPKPPGALRLMALGDSFTLGLQVDEAAHFLARLGPALSEDLGRPVEVFNGGMDGFGTRAATLLAARHVEPLDLDALVLLFFPGNDLWDNMAFGRMVHVPEARPPEPVGPLRWLERRLVLAYGLRVLFEAHTLDVDSPLGRRHRQEASIFVDPRALQGAMVATRPALDGYARLCEVRGLTCTMAVVPPVFTLDERRARATFEALGLPPDTAALQGPARAVIEASRVPALDLGPALREAEAEAPQYFTFDGHWTPAGHATAADALRPFLARALADTP